MTKVKTGRSLKSEKVLLRNNEKLVLTAMVGNKQRG